MDSAWSRFDKVLCAAAPLLAAGVLFACGYIVGRAAKSWYDSVPDYSCCSSESGSDDEEPDSDGEEPEPETDDDIAQAGGITDDSAMEDEDVSGAYSDSEDGVEPVAYVHPDLPTLIEPIEDPFIEDAEDPFIIDDVEDDMEYEHMDVEPPATYEPLGDEHQPASETDEHQPASETDEHQPASETDDESLEQQPLVTEPAVPETKG